MNESFLAKYQNKIILLLIFLLCPLSFFVPRSATWILTIGGLLGFIVCRSKILQVAKEPLSLIILALILWGGLSSFWSLDPQASFSLFIRLFASYLLGVSWHSLLRTQTPKDIQLTLFFLFLGIIVTLVLLLIDFYLGNPWQALSLKTSAKAFVPMALIIAIAIWPAIQWLQLSTNSYVAILFPLCTSLILLLVDCDTAPLGIIAGIIIGGLAYLAPKLINRIGQVLSVVLVLSLPFAIHSFLTLERINQFNNYIHNFSHIHRLYVWQNVSEKIQKNWLKGYGLDTSRNEALGGEKQAWTMITKEGEQISIHSKAIPMHPHNAPLQWWIELGIVGAFLGALLHFYCLSYLSRYQGIRNFIGTGMFVSSSFIAWVNLGFWQSWWIAALWILTGLYTSSHYCMKFENPQN